MYVCVCHGITEKDIQQAINNGAEHVKELRDSYDLGTDCGKCLYLAAKIMKDNKTDLNYDLAKAV
ncbi:(2Fe-2S)-binding protein [Parashewanella curva]|uniref:Bacterioferritin-associated ferredoxin n=1 Tax=Parashewanella curva TaxID=2338552 RepID=A0A3L8Q1D0_9GAMM|nr:(2Fe-2S)-binding protein [Parashewanella curva]RLV61270.1 (2Fe-2S)-binding protein [Parashewanella curva]